MIENKFLPITLIQETEDFEEYTIDFKDNNLRVKSATLIAFDFLRLVFTSASKSAHQTLSYSRRFFRSIMMDYITLDFYLTIFKICFAIASIGWFFFKTTANLAYEEAWKNVPLHYFASKEIDLEHIVTNFSEIDVSHVPKNVSLNNLLEMFNEIPFYDEKKPGYLPPASRIDDKIDRSPTDLETGIKQFIDNVTNKKAITGAPPAQNIDEFNNFYKKIEDAVRFSIHNSNETIKSFKEKMGRR